MPTEYEIDVSLGVVLSSASGILSDADLRDHQDHLRGDSRFRPDFCQLFDMRGLTGINLTTEGLGNLAKSHPFGPGTRGAVVVDSNLAYGLARMFEGMSARTGMEVRAFRDVGEARKWLRLEEARAV